MITKIHLNKILERKNILFISSWFPNKVEPYNGNFVQRHAEAVSLKHDVEILHSIGDFNQKEKYLIDDQLINGIRTLIVYYKNSKNPFQNFYRRMNAYKMGFAKMKKPNLVHANVMHNSMLFAVYLKKKFNISYVVTEHWTAFQEQNLSKTSTIAKIIARYISKNAEYILPVSNNLKSSLILMGIKSPMRVISNVVNTELFSIKSILKDIHTVKFLHVSSLIPRKRPKDIIKNVVKLHQNGYSVSLEIGGDGETQSLTSLVEELCAEEYIKVFGAITYSQVAEKMQNSDCFILFSENETQGCVILESYACGKPVIATKVGGAAEFIIDGLAIGIEKNNTDHLYSVLEKICKNEISFKDEKEIRQFSVKRFSMESIGSQFSEIYDEIYRRSMS